MAALKIVSSHPDGLRAKRAKFHRGQEVQLVSEGPVMTVEKSDHEFTTCVWFDEIGNEPIRHTFLNVTLKRFRGEK